MGAKRAQLYLEMANRKRFLYFNNITAFHPCTNNVSNLFILNTVENKVEVVQLYKIAQLRDIT